MPRAVLVVLLWLVIPAVGPAVVAQPLPESLHKLMPDAKIVGQGRYEFLWFDAYEATLYAPGGKWSHQAPQALELHYFRSIDGEDIAERTVQEMRKQGFSDEVKLAAWYTQLRGIFPDVEDGTRLVGYHAPGGETLFFMGQKQVGVVRDISFGRLFFDIWLSPETSAPELRRELLGLP